MIKSLVTELERLAEALEVEGSAPVEIPLGAMAEKIAKNLGVQAGEVAILGVSTRWRHLHFLVPQALKNVGFIPLSSTSALAARTARESRPEINNNFTSVRHATVFEGVRTATTTGESIQKIISAPILYEGKVVGVMQISRKGATVQETGADFTTEDLGKVLALCGAMGKLVRHLAGE
jgi:GAF domain-containing protein